MENAGKILTIISSISLLGFVFSDLIIDGDYKNKEAIAGVIIIIISTVYIIKNTKRRIRID